MSDGSTRSHQSAVWLTTDAGDFDVFLKQVSRKTSLSDFDYAAEVAQNVPIYDGSQVEDLGVRNRKSLTAEFCRVFDSGPGIAVIKNGISDKAVLNRATDVFEALIESERRAGSGGGDHFAKPGANDRVWNAVQKHCMANAENFVDYYSADAIALASEAWLGPGYQVTAQVNRVNPGGLAQTPHRDYHLGFMATEQAIEYPALVHTMSPHLTLQGAVAHCDMPTESGPTVFLPFSQLFAEGYVAFHRPEYQAYFAEHAVQLPLEKGDIVFFNPALMHGAGSNQCSDIFRLANLLQVSSAFGRAMESVDRAVMIRKLYPILKERSLGGVNQAVRNVVAVSTDGYPFPGNLDTDPPLGGLAPQSQTGLTLDALAKQLDKDAFVSELDALIDRKRSG